MNFSPAFFHGQQGLVAIGLAGLIAVIGVPLVFYVWLRHTKASERALTLTYAISTAVVCGLSVIPTEHPISIFHLAMGTLAGILTLPWNLITLFAISQANNSDISDLEWAVAVLLGAGVNTMIVFFLAKKAQVWKV